MSAAAEFKAALTTEADHMEDGGNEKLDSQQLQEYAKGGTVTEHELTPLQALKCYPMAMFWCIMVSMCVVMEGYDTILIGNFFAYPAFAQKYGSYVPSANNYQLTAAWQAGLGNSGGIGAFFGMHCFQLITWHCR